MPNAASKDFPPLRDALRASVRLKQKPGIDSRLERRAVTLRIRVESRCARVIEQAVQGTLRRLSAGAGIESCGQSINIGPGALLSYARLLGRRKARSEDRRHHL